jgi:hypothetical protein
MRNMLLERKIQVEVHSARFSIKSITSSNLHMWISNLYLPRKTMNCQNRITIGRWNSSLKIALLFHVHKNQQKIMKVICQLESISLLSCLLMLLKIHCLQSNKKNSVIKLEGTGQSHTWVAWTQSHNTWRAVSTPLPRCR